SVNVTGPDTLVFVFDILAAVPTAGHASGAAARYRPGAGLPQVPMSAHDPAVTVPPAAAPTKTLVSRVLIGGDGPGLVPGEPVVRPAGGRGVLRVRGGGVGGARAAGVWLVPPACGRGGRVLRGRAGGPGHLHGPDRPRIPSRSPSPRSASTGVRIP